MRGLRSAAAETRTLADGTYLESVQTEGIVSLLLTYELAGGGTPDPGLHPGRHGRRPSRPGFGRGAAYGDPQSARGDPERLLPPELRRATDHQYQTESDGHGNG